MYDITPRLSAQLAARPCRRGFLRLAGAAALGLGFVLNGAPIVLADSCPHNPCLCGEVTCPGCDASGHCEGPVGDNPCSSCGTNGCPSGCTSSGTWYCCGSATGYCRQQCAECCCNGINCTCFQQQCTNCRSGVICPCVHQ